MRPHIETLAATILASLLTLDPSADLDAVVDLSLVLAEKLRSRSVARRAAVIAPGTPGHTGLIERRLREVLDYLVATGGTATGQQLRNLPGKNEVLYEALGLAKERGFVDPQMNGKSYLGYRITTSGREHIGAPGAFAAVAEQSPLPAR